MDISVIIPSLNGRKYFDEFLSSVISECKSSSYKAEIIIVDDGSDDGSVDYLNNLSSDILKPYKNTKRVHVLLVIMQYQSQVVLF